MIGVKSNDFSWIIFLIFVSFASAVLGGLQYQHSYYVAQAELILFYFGKGAGPFLFVAAVIIPLHFAGKILKNGFAKPKKLIFFCGVALSVAMFGTNALRN